MFLHAWRTHLSAKNLLILFYFSVMFCWLLLDLLLIVLIFELCLLLSFCAVSDTDEQNKHLLSKIKHLELELGRMKSELLSSQGLKTCCDRMDTLHEKVSSKGDFPEWSLICCICAPSSDKAFCVQGKIAGGIDLLRSIWLCLFSLLKIQYHKMQLVSGLYRTVYKQEAGLLNFCGEALAYSYLDFSFGYPCHSIWRSW